MRDNRHQARYIKRAVHLNTLGTAEVGLQNRSLYSGEVEDDRTDPGDAERKREKERDFSSAYARLARVPASGHARIHSLAQLKLSEIDTNGVLKIEDEFSKLIHIFQGYTFTREPESLLYIETVWNSMTQRIYYLRTDTAGNRLPQLSGETVVYHRDGLQGGEGFNQPEEKYRA